MTERYETVEFTILVPAKVVVRKDTGELCELTHPSMKDVKPKALAEWERLRSLVALMGAK